MMIGYHDPDSLPVKAGDRVRIKKGTLLSAGRETWKASRTYQVTVDHTLPGMTYNLGGAHSDGTVYFNGLDRKTFSAVLARHGVKIDSMDYFTGNYDAAALLEELKATGRIELVPHDKCQGLTEIKLHDKGPTIRWAGSRRSWSEAPINDVERVS